MRHWASLSLVVLAASWALPARAASDAPGTSIIIAGDAEPLRQSEAMQLMPAYWESTAQLRSYLDQNKHHRRLFYPLGLADIGAAITAFTTGAGRPTEIAIADLTPFGTPAELRRIHGSTETLRAFQTTLDGNFIDWIQFIRRVGRAGPALLWQLERLGARDIEVRYLTQDGTLRRRPLRRGNHLTVSDDWPATISRSGEGQRSIVEVRYVLDGQPSSVLYVEQDALKRRETPKVLRTFLSEGIDAYLEKAAYGVTNKTAYRNGLLRLSARAMRRDAVLVGHEGYLELDLFTSARRLDSHGGLHYGSDFIYRQPRRSFLRRRR